MKVLTAFRERTKGSSAFRGWRALRARLALRPVEVRLLLGALTFAAVLAYALSGAPPWYPSPAYPLYDSSKAEPAYDAWKTRFAATVSALNPDLMRALDEAYALLRGAPAFAVTADAQTSVDQWVASLAEYGFRIPAFVREDKFQYARYPLPYRRVPGDSYAADTTLGRLLSSNVGDGLLSVVVLLLIGAACFGVVEVLIWGCCLA